jgi:hypothetical protein
MGYELWSKLAGSIIDYFETEDAALAGVRESLSQHGRAYVVDFGLVRRSSGGEAQLIAEGNALVSLALRQAPTVGDRPSANPRPDNGGRTPKRRR